MFTSVPAAGDAEAKIKVEVLEQAVSEVMSLNHAEVRNRLISDGELHAAKKEWARVKKPPPKCSSDLLDRRVYKDLGWGPKVLSYTLQCLR